MLQLGIHEKVMSAFPPGLFVYNSFAVERRESEYKGGVAFLCFSEFVSILVNIWQVWRKCCSVDSAVYQACSAIDNGKTIAKRYGKKNQPI